MTLVAKDPVEKDVVGRDDLWSSCSDFCPDDMVVFPADYVGLPAHDFSPTAFPSDGKAAAER